MRVAEEVVRIDQLRRVVERLVVDQDGAEYRFFGIEVVWKRPFGGSNVRHGWEAQKKKIG
jgi:hypothetical protein